MTSLIDLVGSTPLVQVKKLDTGVCQLFLKLENQNPGGSIKDRIALYMINAAEKTGKLKPGGTIVEATAGNTGIALVQTAVQRGYRTLLVLPDKMSQEKIALLKAMGAEVVITRSDVSKGHPEYYHDLAQRLASEMPNACYISQFTNAANPQAHEETTAPEIWEQMNHKLDAVVVGVGTGGHLTGIGRYLKKVAPQAKMILADPVGSMLEHYVKTKELIDKSGKWLVEGIGEDYIPTICDIDLVSEAFSVSDAESFAAARELLKKEAIFAGSSTGTVLHAALQYCRKQTKPQRVVTFVYDSGSKYLSKMYNDQWMAQHGFSL